MIFESFLFLTLHLLLVARILDQEILSARQVPDVVVSLRIQILLIHPILIWLAVAVEVWNCWPLRGVSSRQQPVVIHGRVPICSEAR